MIQKMLPIKLGTLKKLSEWRKITSGKWIISTVTRAITELEDIADLPLNGGNKVSDSERELFRAEIARLQDMGVRSEVKPGTTGFISSNFIRQKKKKKQINFES